ncbi:glycosyltransferase family 4 protein [Spirosoma knui]
MKVLWIAPLPYIKKPKGHPAPWIMTLSQALSSCIDLDILVCNSDIDKDETFTVNNVNYIYLKTPRGAIDLITFHKYKVGLLRKYLKRQHQKYDIIHIHGSEHQFEQACWDIPVPKLLSVQGIISEYYNHISDKISYRKLSWYLTQLSEKRYLPHIKHFMCRTDWDKRWVHQNVKDAVVHHCWETIRPNFFELKFDSTLNKNILFLGGINDIKGYEKALIAFDLAAESNKDIKLLYAGSRVNETNKIIKEAISKHNLRNINDNNLKLLGFLNAQELAITFTKCYCLLHPSYIDNSPNSICEAQISGLPVIASNVGGVGSLIEHNKTGLLTTLSPEDISTSLLKVYDDKPLAISLAKQGKIKAEKRHDTESIRNITYSIYKEVIHSFWNQDHLQGV